MSKNQVFDIIVIGSGMVGLSFAAALADKAFKVAMVDARAINAEALAADFTGRVSAISHASKNILAHVGAWSLLEAERVCAYQHMYVWDANGSGHVEFDAESIKTEALGYIIENQNISNALINRIKSAKNITLIAPTKLSSLQQLADDHHQQQLLTAEGDSLAAPLIVGADGAHSWLRQQVGIELNSDSYAQRAIVATVKTEQAHQNTAWQRFLSTGPLAFLPLSAPNSCSIVWSYDADKVDTILQLDDAAFIQKLNLAFDRQLGEVLAVSPRLSFPLQMRHAKSYVAPGIALLGDAAHTIHPLAGQGANLGFLDAACLAEILLNAQARQKDFSALTTLAKYQRWRRGHNQLMIQIMSGFKKLFSMENLPVTLIRNWGMDMFDKFMPVKQYIIKQALGMDGDLPEMALKNER